jgi:hypothetical protein
MIENTYVAFRKGMELIILNTNCPCQACANVSTLDLKFFLHYGPFAVQRLGEHDELVGNDVNLLHRLLKNHVSEATGFKAYTLYTDAAIKQMGLEDMSASMTAHQEAYEHLGEVQVWIQDMHPVWETKREANQITLAPENIVLQVEAEIAMPPELVWDYLSHPTFRSIVMGVHRQEIVDRKQGRIAPGSVFQCYHGDAMIPQLVMEWQPFEHMVTRDQVQPGVFGMVDFRLEPTQTGTRLRQSFGQLTGPWFKRLIFLAYFMLNQKAAQRDIDSFKQRIEEDLAAHGGIPQKLATFSPDAIGEAVTASLQA